MSYTHPLPPMMDWGLRKDLQNRFDEISTAISGVGGGGGGGASELSDLSDVNTSTPTNRNVLIADGIDFESRALVEADISDFGTYATAATTLAGYGITDAYTQTQVNALTWDFATDITGKPTTLSGYGITDAATSAQGALADTALQSGANIPWSDVTTTPTTLVGYGITDAATSAQGTLADSATQPGDDADTLGSGAASDGQVLTADGAGGAAWETPAGGGGGGVTPSIFYALGSGSANLGTSLSTVPLAAASKADTGYSLATNEVTIGADLNGKWALITWAVSGNGATNRVEIRSELQINTVRVKGSSNYTARNGTQNTGGVQGFHIAQLSTSDVIRVRALRDGSTANLIADETHLSIVTLS